MKTATIVTGVLLILTGVWCLANQGATFLSLAFVIGIVMLFAGANGFFIYTALKNKGETCYWLVAESVITVILGIVVLSNQLVTDAAIPIFFGMWSMFSGIMRVMMVFSKKEGEERKGWGLIFTLGIVSLGAGIYSFYNPIAVGIAIIILVGIFFILQGAGTLALAFQFYRKKK